MKNFVVLFALCLNLQVLGLSGKNEPIQPNLCGYSNATEFMNLIQEEWWLQELEKLMPDQMAGMMKSIKKVSLKVNQIHANDATTVIEIPKLYQQLLKIRDSAAQLSGENKDTGKRLVAYAEKLLAKVNK